MGVLVPIDVKGLSGRKDIISDLESCGVRCGEQYVIEMAPWYSGSVLPSMRSRRPPEGASGTSSAGRRPTLRLSLEPRRKNWVLPDTTHCTNPASQSRRRAFPCVSL